MLIPFTKDKKENSFEGHCPTCGQIDYTKKPTNNNWTEANIVINGNQLSFSQSMVVRVALESFAMHLFNEGLGEDEVGKAITNGYLSRIEEIRKLMYNK